MEDLHYSRLLLSKKNIRHNIYKKKPMNFRKAVWKILANLYPLYLKKRFGMDIGENVKISYKAKLDNSINPKGIHVGDNTWILAKATVLAHDYCRGNNKKGKLFNTYIGRNCVIGINSIILPGVRLGDHTIVGAGSVVTRDTQENCIVVGNPAKVIKEGVIVSNYGQIIV